eukprot:scaffold486_cov148-Skeletonema_dohrnii-CCMP3373.AAC.12
MFALQRCDEWSFCSSSGKKEWWPAKEAFMNSTVEFLRRRHLIPKNKKSSCSFLFVCEHNAAFPGSVCMIEQVLKINLNHVIPNNGRQKEQIQQVTSNLCTGVIS